MGKRQRELAALVEIDSTYLSKLESDGTHYPPKEYVMGAHYLSLDHEELMCLTGRLPERYQEFLKQNCARYAWAHPVDTAQSRLGITSKPSSTLVLLRREDHGFGRY